MLKKDEQAIASLKEIYNFSTMEANQIYAVYDKFVNDDRYKGLSKQQQIHTFYTNMASLYTPYSRTSFMFSNGGGTYDQEEALEFFEDLGCNSKSIQSALENQHIRCADKNLGDYVHECAMYTVWSNYNLPKSIYNLVPKYGGDINALVGAKGDVWSGAAGIEDKRTDIMAYNKYQQMLKSDINKNIAEDFNDYNKSVVDKNNPRAEVTEYLNYYKKDDFSGALKKLEKELMKNTIGAQKLKSWNELDDKDIEKSKNEYIDYVKNRLNKERSLQKEGKVKNNELLDKKDDKKPINKNVESFKSKAPISDSKEKKGKMRMTEVLKECEKRQKNSVNTTKKTVSKKKQKDLEM